MIPLNYYFPKALSSLVGSGKIIKILGLKLLQAAIFNIFLVSTETRKSENISTRKNVRRLGVSVRFAWNFFDASVSAGSVCERIGNSWKLFWKNVFLCSKQSLWKHFVKQLILKWNRNKFEVETRNFSKHETFRKHFLSTFRWCLKCTIRQIWNSPYMF